MSLILFLSEIIFVCCIAVAPMMVHPTTVAPTTNPIVVTTLGRVMGNVMTSRDNGSFYSFRGIPYAKPPLGNLRFQAPVVADAWNDVFDATKDAMPCIQNNFVIPTSENCLVVNVYSKKLPTSSRPQSSLLPVLVYIHGGGFAGGAAVSYVFFPQAIMSRNVVLVTIAYRLGPFGFLSTLDSAAQGNAGMLDQVMALKFVQRNIAAFGGDPKKVAIVGQSAGAVSVNLLLLSPLGKGLFQAAISESGTALNPWSIQKNPIEFAFKLGLPFNCSQDNTFLLVECLQQQSARDIVYSALDFNAYSALYLPFVPVIETSRNGSFLEEEPLKIITERKFHKVPLITGVNKDEGILIYNSLLQQYNNTTYDVIYQNKLQEIIPLLIHNVHVDENITTAVHNEYFSDVNFNNKSAAIGAAIDMSSDSVFKAANTKTVRLMTDGGATVYMYVFEYAGSRSTSNLTGEIDVNHGDELYYFLYSNTQPMTATDLRISNTLIDMWINFADKRNPTPIGSKVKWTPSPKGKIRYLRIGNNFTMEKNYLTDRMYFWNVVIPQLIRKSRFD